MACASYYDSEVQAASAKYGVPPDIINAVIHQESGGNPNAYNPNDPSYGLMGVQYGTAKDMGYKGPAPSNPPKPTDPLMQPANNIDAGTAYLAYQYKRYGNWPDAISAYNGGHALKNPDGSYANASYVNSVLNCAGQYSTGGAGTGGTTTGGGEALQLSYSRTALPGCAWLNGAYCLCAIRFSSLLKNTLRK